MVSSRININFYLWKPSIIKAYSPICISHLVALVCAYGLRFRFVFHILWGTKTQQYVYKLCTWNENKFIALLAENRNNELPFMCLTFTKGISNVLYWNKIRYVFVFLYLCLEVKDTSWILVTIDILPLQQFSVYIIILQETNNNSGEISLVSIKFVIFV